VPVLGAQFRLSVRLNSINFEKFPVFFPVSREMPLARFYETKPNLLAGGEPDEPRFIVNGRRLHSRDLVLAQALAHYVEAARE
jgi:hypothetical protein